MSENTGGASPLSRMIARSPYIIGAAIVAGVALKVFLPEVHASFCIGAM